MSSDEIDRMPAGREMDRLVAEHVMGCRVVKQRGRKRWDLIIDARARLIDFATSDGAWSIVPHYSTDIAAASDMERRLDERGLSHPYTMLLSMILWGDTRGWEDWRDSWALLRATPEQRCRAALKSVAAGAAKVGA